MRVWFTMKAQVTPIVVIGMALVTLIANILSGQIAVSVLTPYNNVYWCYGNDTYQDVTQTCTGNLTASGACNTGTQNISCSPRWIKINPAVIKATDTNQTAKYAENGYVTDTDGRDWRCENTTIFGRNTRCYFGSERNQTYGQIKLGV